MQVLCRLENGGFGTGHNTVLSLLHSRVHFILNPDIQLTADTLSDLADWMAAHPGVVMTRPGLTFPDPSSCRCAGAMCVPWSTVSCPVCAFGQSTTTAT